MLQKSCVDMTRNSLIQNLYDLLLTFSCKDVRNLRFDLNILFRV